MRQNGRRLEAIPLDWDVLSDIQKNSVESVAKWLLDALSDIDPMKPPHAGTSDARGWGDPV